MGGWTMTGRYAAIVVAIMLVLGGLAVALETAANHALSAAREAPWVPHIEQVDDALARGEVSEAVRAWEDAYSAARASRRWGAMLDLGDAYLRIGDDGGFRKAAEAKAREAYLAALFRARSEKSVDGILRSADAFAALGDADVVENCVRMAESVAGRSASARGAVDLFAARVGARDR